ncbi:MAG: sugar-binding protein [Cytophagaceae bacterium]|jgi:hypothetical protein|nr:sugar-binding protein [Cytophagaceae bacterium]
MKKTTLLSIVTTVLCAITYSEAFAQPVSTTELYKAPLTAVAPTVDGIDSDACWNDAAWVSINNLYLGAAYTPNDFSGRYKMVWTASKIYLLAEITDDVLRDDHANPTTNYWDDDCVEIFLDENKSGGPHQTNYNAFAYHVSLAYEPVDVGTDGLPHVYTDDIFTRKVTTGNVTVWEFAINIYPDTYVYGGSNTAVTLYQGKQLGFNLAYCDNDTGVRNSFIGSRFQQDADKDRGYINADVFATLELVAGTVTSITSEEERTFSIYPNPSNGVFSINTELPIDHILVKNSSGLEVFHEIMNSSGQAHTIDLSKLSKGTYLVQLSSEGKVVSKKVILE